MKEEVDKELTIIDALTESVAQLTMAMKTLEGVALSLLANVPDFKVPAWKDYDELDVAVGMKVADCAKLMRNIYGPDKDDTR